MLSLGQCNFVRQHENLEVIFTTYHKIINMRQDRQLIATPHFIVGYPELAWVQRKSVLLKLDSEFRMEEQAL